MRFICLAVGARRFRLTRAMSLPANNNNNNQHHNTPQHQMTGPGNEAASSRRCLTVCVEGNIGSGKSTLLRHFSRLADVLTLAEPVQQWCNVDGHNLLELMYKDPARWSCLFQTYVQLTMLQQHTLPCGSAAVKMLERSIHSARHCFIENLYNAGSLSSAEYAVLDQWYRYIVSTCSVQPDLIVYLRSTPEVVYERVRARNRSEESAISLSYLQSLHELHERWLIDGAADAPRCPVLVLDADKDMNSLQQEVELRRHEILCHQMVRSPVKNRDVVTSRAAV